MNTGNPPSYALHGSVYCSYGPPILQPISQQLPLAWPASIDHMNHNTFSRPNNGSSRKRKARYDELPPIKRAAVQTPSFPSTSTRIPSVQSVHSQQNVRSEQKTQATLSSQRRFLLDQSDAEISHYYDTHRQLDEDYRSKLKLVDLLYNSLCPHFPGCALYLIGSSVNGFGERGSDIDLCLVLSDINVSWDDAVDNLRIICNLIRRLPSIKRPNLIKATVPILDFYDRTSGKECDMNISNTPGIRNTHLLACYGKYDSRVPPLILFIKCWAKFHNINCAKDQTISSYVLSLMVIHFLQYGVKGLPVLPCLQRTHPHHFPNDIRSLRMDNVITPPPGQPSNTLSLSELLLEFLKYYATLFRYDRDVASVRTGKVIHINEARYYERLNPHTSIGKKQKNQKPPKSTWNDAKLFVEDPIERHNAARCVYSEQAFYKIQHVFRRSYDTYKQSFDVRSIITHPF